MDPDFVTKAFLISMETEVVILFSVEVESVIPSDTVNVFFDAALLWFSVERIVL